ncbi:addiction module antidote protein [Bradyrhizobium sp. USDA 4502]
MLFEPLRDDPQAIAAYLSDKFEKNELSEILTSLSVVVRAQNVQILGRDAGLRRDSLYRTFGGKVDPDLSRVLMLFEALNIRFVVAAVSESNAFCAAAGDKNDFGMHHPTSIAHYLDRSFERNNLNEAVCALKTVTRAQNMSALARASGIPRETLYKSFGGKVDPQLGRIVKLFAAFGVSFTVAALPPRRRSARPKLGRPRKAR